ncbi:MAG: UDP-glucose 4-epimerase GalE [Notoacmeibacter sp.]|nr:UDP-glucose 4-epimerase GalE [Notoacmeibacter sp.]
MTNILVTGGAGYIGAHFCVSLIESGKRPVIFDNLSNSHPTVIDRIEKICGIRPDFIYGDVRDEESVCRAIQDHKISSVVHFAALKAVGQSVKMPVEYYDVNVHGTLRLLAAMRRKGIKQLVFSSSATVYGKPETIPIREDSPKSATNPYGRTKLIVEQLLEDLVRAEPDWRIARLRYFNPIGAHISGLIGEDPKGVPNNLVPYIAQVAVGRREYLSVFGDDYPTRDGSGVRDYIHVMDLAEGHVVTLDYLSQQPGLLTVNLGTGQGYSVFEMISAFETVSGQSVPFQIEGRRDGDIAEYWADTTLAHTLLSWRAKRSLTEMCEDVWRWQSNNPNGYGAP